ncbi:MAG: helix-turn-helix transcriptional regulator [Bacilli bacterium]|nr:helix-turn-helix transcriptional regulator [Bacilli bacterium]MBR3898464.1 helix-turn-helix transcriptional regulator [Bacilli bacterium]
MKKQTTELGKIITEAREKKGISQRELSRQANMDCAEVSRIEAGKRLKPNVLYLKGIAEALDLSMVDLMKLAGYNDLDINWGKDLSSKRSTADYQKQIQSYEKFYFDVLEDIEERRKVDFAVKGCIADLIDKLELASIEKKEISNDEILERLKEIIPMIRPNLEKFDKSKYPSFDSALFPKRK